MLEQLTENPSSARSQVEIKEHNSRTSDGRGARARCGGGPGGRVSPVLGPHPFWVPVEALRLRHDCLTAAIKLLATDSGFNLQPPFPPCRWDGVGAGLVLLFAHLIGSSGDQPPCLGVLPKVPSLTSQKTLFENSKRFWSALPQVRMRQRPNIRFFFLNLFIKVSLIYSVLSNRYFSSYISNHPSQLHLSFTWGPLALCWREGGP